MPLETTRLSEETRAIVLCLRGELDTRSANELLSTLQGELTDDAATLLLDLQHLEYISSAGLRILVMTGRRLKAAGGRLALCALNADVQEVFEITGMGELFLVFPSRAKALVQLTSSETPKALLDLPVIGAKEAPPALLDLPAIRAKEAHEGPVDQEPQKPPAPEAPRGQTRAQTAATIFRKSAAWGEPPRTARSAPTGRAGLAARLFGTS